MKIITDRAEFAALARELGVRPDWHEPDEQGVRARVEGLSFDNAGFWPAQPFMTHVELHVIFSVCGEGDHTVCDVWDDGTCLCECDGDGDHQHGPCEARDVAAVNLATLCAWAAGLRD
jgi:hypothetical protein